VPIWRDRSTAAGPVAYTEDQADLRAAYNRGRVDERRSRRHHPFIALAVVILALIGAWLLFLAAREGSFSSAGQVADQNLSTVAQEAGPALRQTGEQVKDAGGAIKEDLSRSRDSTAPTSQPQR
jgi:hypothetical protein